MVQVNLYPPLYIIIYSIKTDVHFLHLTVLNYKRLILSKH